MYTYTRKVTLDEFESKPRKTMVGVLSSCTVKKEGIPEDILFDSHFGLPVVHVHVVVSLGELVRVLSALSGC